MRLETGGPHSARVLRSVTRHDWVRHPGGAVEPSEASETIRPASMPPDEECIDVCTSCTMSLEEMPPVLRPLLFMTRVATAKDAGTREALTR